MAPEAFLRSLGATSDEVAESLRKAGIRGGRAAIDCPLAKRIHKAVEDGVLDEKWREVRVWQEGLDLPGVGCLDSSTHVVKLPKPCAQFVWEYDNTRRHEDLKANTWSLP